MKKIDFKTFKEFIGKPRVIIWVVVLITIFVFGLLMYLIYVKDQPSFVPEEAREDIRGSIVENVGEPIGKVLPNLKTVIVNAAWTKDKKENDGNSYGHFNDEEKNKDDKTKDWPTYTDPETGVSIKYPEGWAYNMVNDGAKFFDKEFEYFESEHPSIIYTGYPFVESSLDEWLGNNKEIFIGEQDSADVDGFLDRIEFKIGSLEALSFYYDNMGVNKVTLVEYNNFVLIFEAVTLNNNSESMLLDYYEDIVSSLK